LQSCVEEPNFFESASRRRHKTNELEKEP